MTGGREKFLAAIAESPLDPAPRQVYADWLDEAGEYDAAAEQRSWTAEKLRARMAIARWSEDVGLDYETVMAALDEFVRSGEECYPPSGNMEPQRMWLDGIWDHYRVITVVTRVHDEFGDSVPFSCSC